MARKNQQRGVELLMGTVVCPWNYTKHLKNKNLHLPLGEFCDVKSGCVKKNGVW